MMHAIRKGQLMTPGLSVQTPTGQFYALAMEIINSDNLTHLQRKIATEPFSASQVRQSCQCV